MPSGGEPLILASASPQRRAILTQLGVRFEVRPADVDELSVGIPEEVAQANASRKASVIYADAAPGSRVLGVDTLVTLDGEIFGKPADANAAATTLGRLAGRTHEVLSGIVLLGGGSRRPGGERMVSTRVSFRPLTPGQIERYVATGEWRGRAGGYAIQERGAALVERIEGDYTNVVGLPVAALIELAGDLL
ncbi:MAG: septum formation protein Maf [Solirubrobacterales bacterium]|nr:septum formation protein Maf [Solirubrobacterales bacterium]